VTVVEPSLATAVVVSSLRHGSGVLPGLQSQTVFDFSAPEPVPVEAVEVDVVAPEAVVVVDFEALPEPDEHEAASSTAAARVTMRRTM